MSIYIKLFLLILFSSFYKIACAQHNGNINFTIGSTYNYRDFNESRYKFSKRRINEFNKYDEVLDSIDVPVIAPYEAKIDTFNNNGFMFRTGLQFGIKATQ